MSRLIGTKQQTLFDVLQKNGRQINSPCGGKGTCGKCKVQIIAGKAPPPCPEELEHFSDEELLKNVRLSCRLIPTDDLVIKLPKSNRENHQILIGENHAGLKRNPAICKDVFSCRTSTTQSPSYLAGLAEILDISDLIEDPVFLQSVKNIFEHDQLTAVYANNRLIGLEGGDTCDNTYGVAVDIGTTTVVVSLMDLNTGRQIDCATALNPQNAHGQDVLSRIEFAKRKDDGLDILHKNIIDCLNQTIDTACKKNRIDQETIYDITVSANTTMLHLLLGVDPSSMGRSPYQPVFTQSLHLKAAAFGLRLSPFARLYCLPSVSSYIGADIVAGVAICRLRHTTGNVLFIDIGTNGEIVLSKNGALYACSCAAGPALEGMNISCGMLAGSGAIEGVRFTDKEIRLEVIGNDKPQGLCGSGIIDAVAEIVRTGLIEKTGRLKKREDAEQDSKIQGLARFIEEKNKRRTLVLDPANRIVITQADIRQVQLAKGAILSGIHALLNRLEMQMEDLDKIIISGQFGSHLRVDSLVGIGLIPPGIKEKISYIGNSAHTGAIMCLLATAKRQEVEDLAKQIHYLELTALEDYEKLFIRCLGF